MHFWGKTIRSQEFHTLVIGSFNGNPFSANHMKKFEVILYNCARACAIDPLIDKKNVHFVGLNPDSNQMQSKPKYSEVRCADFLRFNISEAHLSKQM